MALIIKAWLMKRGGDYQSSEVRLFTAEPSVTDNYTAFASKINEVFPALSGKIFNIYWKDDDNDEVSISTNQELADALGCAPSGVFRVIIKPRDDEQTTNKDLHPNVVCDGCETGVRGTRYKCCVCPDYDLCESCESRGVHQIHDMLAIRNTRPSGCHGPNHMNVLLPFPWANRRFGHTDVRGRRCRLHSLKGPYGFSGPRRQPGHQGLHGLWGHGHRGPHGPWGPHGPHNHHGPHGSWGSHDPNGPCESHGSCGPRESHGPHGPHGAHGPQGPWGVHNHHGPHGLFGRHGLYGTHGSWGSHCPFRTCEDEGSCHTGSNCCDMNDEDGGANSEPETTEENDRDKSDKCQTCDDVGCEQFEKNTVVPTLEPVGVMFEMDVDEDSDRNSCQEVPKDTHTHDDDGKEKRGTVNKSDHSQRTPKSDQEKLYQPSVSVDELCSDESDPSRYGLEQETGEKEAVAEGAASCGNAATKREKGGTDAMDTDNHSSCHEPIIKGIKGARNKPGSKTSGK